MSYLYYWTTTRNVSLVKELSRTPTPSFATSFLRFVRKICDIESEGGRKILWEITCFFLSWTVGANRV